MQNRAEFSVKNTRITFKNAIHEADLAITPNQENLSTISSNSMTKITLKNMEIGTLLATFSENQAMLESLFEDRRYKLDRLNSGNGYNFLTVLSRMVTSKQQTEMYQRIRDSFVKDTEKYIGNPMVRIHFEIEEYVFQVFTTK